MTPARALALVARHRGVLAHARKGWMVAAFPPQCTSTPMTSALAAARSLLSEGASERVLVDVDIVGVRTDGDMPLVFSPQFGFVARYPDDGDPTGLAFTKSAAEAVHDVPMLPLTHRTDRLVDADADACALASATECVHALHGRADLLTTLHGAAIEASAGIPTLATVTGEPGSGRTRLAAAITAALATAARIVAFAAPDAGAKSCTAIALRRLLDLDDPMPTEPREMLASKLACASADVPIGLLLALEWADADDPIVKAMRAAPGAIRTCVALAVAELLRTTAAREPLVVVVDDADRAEPAWLDAVEAATLAEHGAPLLVCMLAREAFAADRPAWSTRAGRSLPLDVPPLDLAATGDLVRELLQPAHNVPDAAIAAIHLRTRGLPLLVVELARVLRSAGALQRVPGGTGWAFVADVLQRVPDLPLAAWMAQREIDRLPSALARHAAVVAAMGPNSEPGALEATLARLDREGSPLPTVLDPEVAATRLLAAGVLRRDGDGIVFRHAALRERAAASLDEASAKRLHAAAHAVLAAVLAPTREQRAARLHHALGAGLRHAAGADALALAIEASRRHAYLEAESCYAIAIAHVDPDSEAAVAAAHGRGLMRFRLGRHEDARTDLARVVAGVHGERKIEALLDAATVEDWCEDFDRAEVLVDEVQALGAGDSPEVQARLALARGRIAFRRGRIDEAIALLTDAVAAAERLGDVAYETHVIALVLLAPLLGMTGQADRSLPLFDRLFELCDAHSDRIHLATAFLNRPFVWIELQQYEHLHEDLDRVIALSRAAGFPLLECRALYNLGEIAYLLGELSEAERHAESLVDLQRQLGGENQRILVTQLLAARCRARAGDFVEASVLTHQIRLRQAEARLAGTAGFDLMTSDEILCRMVELACTEGDPTAWAELIAWSERESVQQEHIEVLELAGLAAARRGDTDAARDLLQRALAVTETTPTMLRPRVEAALRSLVSPPEAARVASLRDTRRSRG